MSHKFSLVNTIRSNPMVTCSVIVVLIVYFSPFFLCLPPLEHSLPYTLICKNLVSSTIHQNKDHDFFSSKDIRGKKSQHQTPFTGVHSFEMLIVLLIFYVIMFPIDTDNGNTDMSNLFGGIFLLLLLYPTPSLTQRKGELPVGFNHNAAHTGCYSDTLCLEGNKKKKSWEKIFWISLLPCHVCALGKNNQQPHFSMPFEQGWTHKSHYC